MAGYAGFRGDENGNTIAEQTEYELPVAGSLMGKALTAQSVFGFNFLLPFAPDAPDFFIIPGDNQVSVLWQPSPTETTGDPFFVIASQVTTTDTLGNIVPNSLYDPNYRQSDVEGYRVYRGRVDNPNELQLLASFDYTGTFISDFAGQVNPTISCAPEIGVNVFTPIVDSTGAVVDSTPGCPVAFDTVLPGVPRTVSNPVPLVGQLTQVQLTGGRDKLATGPAIHLKVDTAMTGNNFGAPDLSDNGVPFVFVDRTARNNLRYFYSVVAFDVNSFQSGPSSLESPRNTKPAVASHTASNLESVATLTQSVEGRGVNVSQGAVTPTIDPATGRFSGKQPPADNIQLGFAGGSFAQTIFTGTGTFGATLIGLGLGDARNTIPVSFTYETVSSTGVLDTVSLSVAQPLDNTNPTGQSGPAPAATSDPTLAARFGVPAGFVQNGQVTQGIESYQSHVAYGRGCQIDALWGDAHDCTYNGPRWFSGPNETKADPNAGNVAGTGDAADNNNAGELPGVLTVFNPQSYHQIGAGYRTVESVLAGAARAADISVYWGGGRAGRFRC